MKIKPFSICFLTLLISIFTIGNLTANAAASEGCAISDAKIKTTCETLQNEVSQTTKQLFLTLKKNKVLYDKSPEAFYSKIEEVLSPVVAFNSVARGVMGKYAHRVKKDEFDHFVAAFRHSLIVFYSKVLKNYDTSNLNVVSVTPPYAEQIRSYETGHTHSVPVNIAMTDGKNNYQVSYSMMRDENKWKIRNIIVEGINIGIQFRNQFAEAIGTYDTPQRVILNWHRIMESKPVKNTGKAVAGQS